MQPECLIQGAASASFLFAGSGIVMLLFFFLALLAGRLRGRRVGVVFCQKSLMPYLVLELCYIGVQVSAFCGYYGFVPYASWIKRLYFLVLLVPVLVHRLYIPAISGAGAAAGTLLNRLVMNANGGKMPVFATLSRWTGYFTPDFAAAGDTIHMVGDSSVKLAFLADYIDLGYCILSIGDLLIHSFTFIIIYAVVRAVCPLKSSCASRSHHDA